MHRRSLLTATAALTAGLGLPRLARAQDQPLTVGMIAPLTGPFAAYGQQMEAGFRLYAERHGDRVAGRRIVLSVQDDGGTADATRRIAQEMVTRGGVEVLAGFGLTPLAMAAAPVSARAGVAQIVMVAATSAVTEASPMIVRTSYTTPQVTSQIARYMAGDGIAQAMTLVMDYGPGLDAERTFVADFMAAGGSVAGSLRVPMQNPDFAPFLQRVADAAPQALFVFLPSGVGAPFLKQWVERGLDRSGIRLVADGSVTDDIVLPQMGDAAVGVITGLHYTAHHPSAMNRAFVADFMARHRTRPNFMAVAAYDGAHLIHEALKSTGGDATGEALVGAMKGMAFESPRGPIRIDPDTRDIIQDIHMMRVERIDGELWNVAFKTFPAVKDPGKG